MSFSKLCRSCMKEVDSLECKTFDESLVRMFVFCTQVKVTSYDELPKLFCCHCTEQITSSYTFIKKAQEINEIYKSIFYNDSVKTEQNVNVIYLQNQTEVKNETNDLSQYLNIYQPSVEQTVKTKINSKTDATRSEIMNRGTAVTNTDDFFDHGVIENQNKDIIKKDKVKKSLINMLKAKISKFKRKGQQKVEKKYNIFDETEKRNRGDSIDTVAKIFCPICSKTFSKRSQIHLLKHMEEHSETNINALRTKSNKCVSKRNYENRKECVKCRKTFISEFWYTRHMEKQHPSMPTISVCSFCSETFDTAHQLRYHVDMKHEESKQHVCNVCGKRFKLRKQLAVHVLSHSSQRLFICDICNMSFKMKHVLVNHMVTHQDAKKFLCSYCGRRFYSDFNFQEHLRTHTGEKPFLCTLCDFQCAQKGGLRRHIQRVHTDNRPYQCTCCEKTFNDNASLVKHVRIHTGARPYICPQCPMTFISTWNRKLHLMKIHHFTLKEIPKLTVDGRLATT